MMAAERRETAMHGSEASDDYELCIVVTRLKLCIVAVCF